MVNCCRFLHLRLRTLISIRSHGSKPGLFVCIVFLFFTGLMFLCFGCQTQLVLFSLLLPGLPSAFMKRRWFSRKRKWTPIARHCGCDLNSMVLVSWSSKGLSVSTFLASPTVSLERIRRFVTVRRKAHGRAVSIKWIVAVR